MVSVLIAAHNEQKNIGKVLRNLELIRDTEYKNMEIIVGSDASTDRTDDIVKSFSKVIMVTSKDRLGKAGMLKRMYAVAKGDIFIIHDADWVMEKGKFKNIIKYFDNPKVGGISNNRIPSRKTMPSLAIGEAMTYVRMRKFNILRNAERWNGMIVEKVDSSFPFMVDIFRRSACPKPPETLCDDGERSMQIRSKGWYKVVVADDVPSFVIDYSSSPGMLAILRHGVRRSVARKQAKVDARIDFYAHALFFMLAGADSAKETVGIASYWGINLMSSLISSGTDFSTKEGWEIRCRQ